VDSISLGLKGRRRPVSGLPPTCYSIRCIRYRLPRLPKQMCPSLIYGSRVVGLCWRINSSQIAHPPIRRTLRNSPLAAKPAYNQLGIPTGGSRHTGSSCSQHNLVHQRTGRDEEMGSSIRSSRATYQYSKAKTFINS
jgi:hypothetical protein